MARTGNHYENWLRGDNTINIQGRSMVLVHCPSPHKIPDRQTKRQQMLPPWEHKNSIVSNPRKH